MMRAEDIRSNYRSIEGLDNFLFSLNPVIECLELNDIQISVYVSNNSSDLYIRIWEGFNSSQTYFLGLVHCAKFSFAIKDLKNIFINRILIENDELEMYFTHIKKSKEVISKVTVTKSGEVIFDKKRLEMFDSPFEKALNNLTLNHAIISDHPNYMDIAFELIDELEYNPHYENVHYEYEPASGLGGTDSNAFSFLGQKLRHQFETSEKLWINSGVLTDQIVQPSGGLRMSYQYFITFRLKEDLHFFLSAKMESIFLSKIVWLPDMNCSVKFGGNKFDFENYEDDKYLEWIKVEGNHSLESRKIELCKNGINVSNNT